MKSIWFVRVRLWMWSMLWVIAIIRMVSTPSTFERVFAASLSLIAAILAQRAFNEIDQIKEDAYLRKISESRHDTAPHDRI